MPPIRPDWVAMIVPINNLSRSQNYMLVQNGAQINVAITESKDGLIVTETKSGDVTTITIVDTKR